MLERWKSQVYLQNIGITRSQLAVLSKQLVQGHIVQQLDWSIATCTYVPHIHSSITYSTSYANKNQIMLGWKDALHLSVAYGNFEGLDIIKEQWSSSMTTPKHSLLAKIITWYLNGTNYLATNMQIFLTSGTLYNLPNPHQSNDWYDVTKRVQH